MWARPSPPSPGTCCLSAPAKSSTWTAGFTCGDCSSRRKEALISSVLGLKWASLRRRLRRQNMAIKIDNKLTPQKLVPKIGRLFELSAQQILSLEKTWKPETGEP